jgi:hypothetical protein
VIALDLDIKMDVKMNNKCFPSIARLASGEPCLESEIDEILGYIEKRYDCADFRMVCILRTLLGYQDLVSTGMLEKMKVVVLGFKYWMDEPGEDSMCYWSENHQLLFATCEYLAGQLYPEETFGNSGMSGLKHKAKGKGRLDFWFWCRFRFGFSEWHSNTYYEEDVAPLSLLIDFCLDEHIGKKAVMAMDLLLLDMALFSYRGLLCAASGRCYEAQKKDPYRQDVSAIADKAFGLGLVPVADYTKLSAEFLLNIKYRVPGVIRNIALDRDSVEIKASMGLDLSEVKSETEKYEAGSGKEQDMLQRGMFLWAMEAFTNPESINLAVDIFNAWKLGTNGFLKDLKKTNIPIARRLGLLPLVVRILNPATQGIAIQRGNVSAFKTQDFMLSCAQNHHPGEFGDQQHIWQLTVGKGVSVFSTHPGAAFFGDNARNFSPSYWVGNGILPHAAQHRQICLVLHDLRVRKGFMEKPRQMFSHAWFPEKEFDETFFGASLAAGRSERGYAALISLRPFERVGDSELIQRGDVTAWACLAGDEASSGSFALFLEKTKESRLSYSRRDLIFETHGVKPETYRLAYKKGLYVNDELQDTQYGRLSSPYGDIGRNPGEMSLFFGSKLRLDFEKLIREADG